MDAQERAQIEAETIAQDQSAKMNLLTKQNEQLLARVQTLEKERAGMEDTILVLDGQVRNRDKERIAHVIMPASGLPTIELIGPWARNDWAKLGRCYDIAFRLKLQNDRDGRKENEEKNESDVIEQLTAEPTQELTNAGTK